MNVKLQILARHPWLTALAGLTILQIASSGLLRGATLAGTADVLQFTIMLLMLAGVLSNVPSAKGHARGFWLLMALAVAMWTGVYGIWLYHEVIRHTPVPYSGARDMLLALHVVPIMMAMAVLPHRKHRAGALPSSLEFLLIGCWWLYLYFQFVFVWQYFSFYPAIFHRNFNALYHCELAIIIVSLFYLWRNSRGGWHGIYGHYLRAFLLYAPTSAIVTVLIQEGIYHSGGFIDLPLTVSLAYIAWTGFYARSVKLETGRKSEPLSIVAVPDWAAGIGAISIPVIALFSYERLHDPAGVRHFRVALGFTAMFVMAVLIFTRQRLLNQRLTLSLQEANHAFENLERLQMQFMQSEKLASIGRLVSGAAHELNNPLTAILGYSELLASDAQLPQQQRGFAEKIGQQARRTKHLISNLLSFARQTPAMKRLVDLNALINNACQLRMSELPGKITLVRDLQADLPQVLGDDNHLLQVCLHILNNAVDAVEGVDGGEIIVRTVLRDDRVVMEICDNGPGVAAPLRVFDPFYTTKPLGKGAGLGLSACYGIVQEHDGVIECINLDPRGAMIRVSLKVAERPKPVAPAAGVDHPGALEISKP